MRPGARTRLLATGLTLILLQLPVVAYAIPSTGSEPPPEHPHLPPPLDRASRELVPADVEDEEENQQPITLPSIEEIESPTDLLAHGKARPVSATETEIVYDAHDPFFEGSSHIALVSSAPTNYLDGDGKWKPIDASLHEELGGWTNTAGPFDLFLPQRLTPATPVTFSLPEGQLSFDPENADPSVKGKEKDTTITYGRVLPDTDLVYTSAPEGLKEEIVLSKAKASPQVSFLVTGAGLSLAPNQEGGIDVLSDATLVATFPAPVVSDAAESVGSAYFSLQSLGPQAWRLTTAIDAAWYTDPARAFPVTIDPVVSTFVATQDSWVNSQSVSTNYGSATTMSVQCSSAPGCKQGLVAFNLSSVINSDRQVLDAQLWLQGEEGTTGSFPFTVSAVTSPWSQSTVNYTNKPTSGAVVATASSARHEWATWDIPALVEEWVTNVRPNYGIYIGQPPGYTALRTFSTSEDTSGGGSLRPYLVIEYNDPPGVAQQQLPAQDDVVESESPALRIEDGVTDPNGDRVYIRYEVATDSGFTDIVAQSGWLERQNHWVVPAGALKDGGTYYWRVRTSDRITGHNGTIKELLSPNRRFSVSIKKWGSDPKWSMWGTGLGNGVRLEVNEANGNLFLDYPLDSLATETGPLDLHLSYNSQQTKDFDFSGGWVVSAGPGADPGPMPVALGVPSWGGAFIRFSDGSRQYFPKLMQEQFGTVAAGGGTLTRSDSAPRWRYRTATGSKYSFDQDGQLVYARPATGDWSQEGFIYGYSAVGEEQRLRFIRDPRGREVTFTWTNADEKDRLSTITTWDLQTWTLDYSGDKLIKVTDPNGDQVSFDWFNNDQMDLLAVTDGEGDVTGIAYVSPLAGQPAKVSEISPPGVLGSYMFVYSGPYTGQMASETSVEDPRGAATPDPEDFLVRTQFNVAGLPIMIEGPIYDNAVWPVTTQQWDTNSNLICRRQPEVNFHDLWCDSPSNATPDPQQTDWAYQNRVPYLVERQRGPQDENGIRPETLYEYDDGWSELYVEYFDNVNLAGEPVGAGFQQGLNMNFGSAAPAALGTQVNNWSMRLTGRLEVEPDRYWFNLFADPGDGVRLTVGSKEIFNCWTDAQAPACLDNEDFEFTEGERRFVLEFRDLSGTAQAHVKWHRGSTTPFETIPASATTPGTNLLTKVTDSAGETTFAYQGEDRARRRVSSETRAGRTTSYGYDSFGRVLTVTDPRGEATTTVYNHECVDTVTDRTGAVVDYACNGEGDIISEVRTIRAVAGQPVQTRTTGYTHDDLGRLETVSRTLGSSSVMTVSNEYDHAGRLISSTDALGAVTEYVYNPRGLVTLEMLPDPDGAGPDPRPTISHSYDGAGNRISTTDARGQVWRTTYDALNRVRLSKDPFCDLYGDTDARCSITQTVYNLPANSVVVTDAAGVTHGTTFDLYGRAVADKQGALPATVFDYDPAGRLVEQTDPANVTTTKTYNVFGQVTSETVPAGTGGATATTEFDYDLGGRMEAMTDALGRITEYGYDDEGRLVEVRQPLVPVVTTSYTLNDAGEMVSFTDGAGKVRGAEYDEWGRRTETSDARGTTTYTYDNGSRLFRVDLPNGVVQRFEYDRLGRRTRRYGQTSSGTVDDESYRYDPAGNMTRASRTGGTQPVDMTYDPAGRIESVAAQGVSTTFHYLDGRLSSRDDAAGTTSFTYNTNGQLQSISTPDLGTATYDYYADGRKHTRSVSAAGLVSTWTYDEAGRVDTLLTTRASTTVASADLGYDLLGNVTSKNQHIQSQPASENGTWSYLYDEASRLIRSTDPAGEATQYGYDGAGNRTSVKVGSRPTVTTSYDGAGHPYTATNGADYTTDATGALTKVSEPGSVAGLTGVTTYAYDTWGRLTAADRTLSPGVPPTVQDLPESLDYTYDALDRTTSRTSAILRAVPVTTATTYRYGGLTQEMVKETTGEGSPLASSVRYFHTPEGPLGSSATGPTGTEKSWFVADPHGDVVAQVSTSQTTGTRSYSPWGEQRSTSGTAPGPFGFQGDWTDPSTDLVDMGARLYAGGLGRFTTMDPLEGTLQNPMSLNRFAYALGNPVTFDDPTGLCVSEMCASNSGRYRKWQYRASVKDDYEPSPPSSGNSEGQTHRTLRIRGLTTIPGAGIVYGGFFIANPTPAGGLGFGDGREFNSMADADDYRAYFRINFETGRGFIRVNDSCNVRGCLPPLPITRAIGGFGSNQVSLRPSGRGTTFTFRLVNSRAPIAAIDARIRFDADRIVADGRRIVAHGFRNPYPSFEIYQQFSPGSEPRAIVLQREASATIGPFDLALVGLVSPHPIHF